MIVVWNKFLDNRKYSRNVNAKTLRAYGQGWSAWSSLLPEDINSVTSETVEEIVVGLRKRGISVVSVNSYLRTLRAFLGWAYETQRMTANVKVRELKCEVPIMRTFTDEQIASLLRCEPEGVNERRIALFVKILIDTGLRATEALELKRQDIDLDNQVLTVRGKGGKHRMVPISRTTVKTLARLELTQEQEFLFATREGTRLTYRNGLRDFVQLCERLGIRGRKTSFHSLRATFASHYIASGGDVLRLQRILGHSTLTMTSRYVQLATKDLVRNHDQRSLAS